MCTAVSYNSDFYHYFGRNLDLDYSYNEAVTITPRNFNFKMRCVDDLQKHYALIGMATVFDGVPLYYEATNEKGLSVAGLNFPDNADYKPLDGEKQNVTPFEFIPFVLADCATVDEVKALLPKINLVNICFSDGLPLAPLHFIISDCKKSITVECVKDGLKIYNNPVGVMTNNPTFDWHLMNLNNYLNLHNGAMENKLTDKIRDYNYSLGLGALGLPGDFSSPSRFIKATFVKENSPTDLKDFDAVNQFFHILSSVAMPKGCVNTPRNEFEYTRYSCCCNTKKGDYYYTTYDNSSKVKISMQDFDLNSSEIFVFQLEK